MLAVRLRKQCGRGVEFLRFPVPGRSRTIVRFPPVTRKIHPLSCASAARIARLFTSHAHRHPERSRRVPRLKADTKYRFLLLSRWLRLQYLVQRQLATGKISPPLLCRCTACIARVFTCPCPKKSDDFLGTPETKKKRAHPVGCAFRHLERSRKISKADNSTVSALSRCRSVAYDCTRSFGIGKNPHTLLCLCRLA